MNIRNLLAITLLTITVISQAFNMPDRQGRNQSQERMSPDIDQDLDGLDLTEVLLHQMHIGQEESQMTNLSPVTTNTTPVVAPPVSPILSMLQEGGVAEAPTHVITQRNDQTLPIEAAMSAYRRIHQSRVRVPNNSPENDSNAIIVPIDDDFAI